MFHGSTQIPLKATCLSNANHRSGKNNAEVVETCYCRTPLDHPSPGVDTILVELRLHASQKRMA
jgi:hypothetical protein